MFDYGICGGTVVDGRRTKRYTANLYVQDGKIAAITTDILPAKTVFDAKGLTVAPGFIDIHSHSDTSFLKSPEMKSMLSAGVTFQLGGLCGGSAVPSKDARFQDMDCYANFVAASGISTDLGLLIGHGTLRSLVAGDDMRQVTQEELAQMCELLDKLLSQGALGLSLGLIYPPGSFCDTAEIIALAHVVRRHDKMLAVHMRNENVGVFDALDEMIHVAEVTGVKLEISHFKLMGRTQWGRADELLAKVDLARAHGVRIHCDQYPYLATGSGLLSSLPKRAADGGIEAMERNFRDDTWYAELAADGFPELYRRADPDKIVISTAQGCPEYVGKSVAQIAEENGLSLTDAIRGIMLKTHFSAHCHYFSMDEGDVLKIMARRDICVCSDGRAYNLEESESRPHPRYAGTFPRALRLMREHRLMPLEDAVYKMTGLPAAILGFDNQFGRLAEGLDATITVFDAENITDCATYDNPVQASKGIELVLVRGTAVYERGEFTKQYPGKVQRR